MTSKSFVATAWNNGNPSESGAGFGFKVGIADRDRFFEKSWPTVTLQLAAGRQARTTEVNCAKDSFWNGTCRELIGKEIGRWFIDNGFAPWTKGRPPRFRIRPVAARVFEVTPCED